MKDVEAPSGPAIGGTESMVERAPTTGCYKSKGEVVHRGIHLVEGWEEKLGALDAALARGIADADAGRVNPADEVFAELRRRYKEMIEIPSE